MRNPSVPAAIVRRWWSGWGRPSLVAFILVAPPGANVSKAAAIDAPIVPSCAGDCDGVGDVTVDELVVLIGVALGTGVLDLCPTGDANRDGAVTIEEIVAATRRALFGCPLADVCGNDVVDGEEQCDDGGVCVGGPAAGTVCVSERDCLSGGACFGGLDDLRACDADADCRGGRCVRCRPIGGDGCAANCTFESDTLLALVPGMSVDFRSLVEGTSGFIGYGLATIFVSLEGEVVLTSGQSVDGVTPIVMKQGSTAIPPSRGPLVNGCACVRMIPTQTCGGTLFEKDGSDSIRCVGDAACPADRPCVPLHGRGNLASGFAACGMPAANIDRTQDCNGISGAPPFPPVTLAVSDAAPVATDVGNGQLVLTMSAGFAQGFSDFCVDDDPAFGPDRRFCTDDDPADLFVLELPLVTAVFTTGSSISTVLNHNDLKGDQSGPFILDGSPFVCGASGEIDFAGGAMVGASPLCDVPTLVDLPLVLSLGFRSP